MFYITNEGKTWSEPGFNLISTCFKISNFTTLPPPKKKDKLEINSKQINTSGGYRTGTTQVKTRLNPGNWMVNGRCTKCNAKICMRIVRILILWNDYFLEISLFSVHFFQRMGMQHSRAFTPRRGSNL